MGLNIEQLRSEVGGGFHATQQRLQGEKYKRVDVHLNAIKQYDVNNIEDYYDDPEYYPNKGQYLDHAMVRGSALIAVEKTMEYTHDSVKKTIVHLILELNQLYQMPMSELQGTLETAHDMWWYGHAMENLIEKS